MGHKADSFATTFKDKKPPKVVSHVEVHPSMGGGHAVHTVHTHGYEHPAAVKNFKGPHAEVSIPKGHVLAHVAEQMNIPNKGLAAGDEENVSKKEAAEV
jgi:hypothetical protein